MSCWAPSGQAGPGEGGYLPVWAPHAAAVSVVGDFNQWDETRNPMKQLTEEGVWELYIPRLQSFDSYKYAITDADGQLRLKADPFAFHAETRPGTASKYFDISQYQWGDGEWLARRAQVNALDQPINIYEMHLGSWRRYKDGSCMDYEKLAEELIPYLQDMGYTHLELMPITEYPLDDSGISGHRLLCPHLPLRHSRRLYGLCGPAAPGRHRRAAGLGARPLSQGCQRPVPL